MQLAPPMRHLPHCGSLIIQCSQSSASLAFAWVSHSHCISLLGLNSNLNLPSAFLGLVSMVPFPRTVHLASYITYMTLLSMQIYDSGLRFQPLPLSGLFCVRSATQILRVEWIQGLPWRAPRCGFSSTLEWVLMSVKLSLINIVAVYFLKQNLPHLGWYTVQKIVW